MPPFALNSFPISTVFALPPLTPFIFPASSPLKGHPILKKGKIVSNAVLS